MTRITNQETEKFRLNFSYPLTVTYLLQGPAPKQSQHFNAAYRSIVGCNLLRAFDHPLLRRVMTYCDTLGVIGSNLKIVKIFMQHLWMLHDVRATMSHPGMRTRSIPNMSQHVATTKLQHVAFNCCDRLPGGLR